MKVALSVLVVCLALGFTAGYAVEENGFHKFMHFIEHFGHEGLAFLKCMGPKFVHDCSKVTLECLSTHDVVKCVEDLKCGGHDAKLCIHHLKKH